jgi:hypothetical protein
MDPKKAKAQSKMLVKKTAQKQWVKKWKLKRPRSNKIGLVTGQGPTKKKISITRLGPYNRLNGLG